MTDLTPRVVLKFPKQYRKADRQSERRIVPFGSTLRPGRNSVWGRSMLETVFQAIEHDEGLEAAIEAFRQKIKQYERGCTP